MVNMVNLKINGIDLSVPAGTTIIEAARECGIDIPSLCYLRGLNAIGSCRMCVVEVKGARGPVASCVYPVSEGMEVFTNTPAIQKARKLTLELILANHRRDCLNCVRNQNCELQSLSDTLGVREIRYDLSQDGPIYDKSAMHLVRDNSKCILCRRCVSACKNWQYVSVIGANERGFETKIGCAFDMDLGEVPCIACGQCMSVCPVGALTEKDDTQKVWDALNDPTKHVVVGTAPSVRAGLGEEFGMPIGTNVQGKMVAALRRLGFAKVFDVDTAADVTIMEEGTELLERIKSGKNLPLITSCSPGWIRFAEFYLHDFMENISTCKSPQQMFGALMKTYYAQKFNIDPKDMYVVSIMPCTAKKYEIIREHENASGYPDVDVSLTSRELARMIRSAGIRFTDLPNEDFDPAFGEGSGAGHIFGASGGVMEAALRTVSEIVTGKPLEKLEFHDIRGTSGIKEAEYDMGGVKVKCAVASGAGNIKRLFDMIRSGEKQYTIVEVMACPGGCVNGGGQPIQPAKVRGYIDIRELRAAALYSEDAAMTLRKSHENEIVKKVYDEFLGKPGSHKAHELIHTSYQKRDRY